MVNTASTAGLVGSPGLSAYVASKHGVIGLTRTAAGEVGAAGVRVNAVCPGPTDTRMIRSLERQSSPGDHAAVAEEVADVVLFLCSDLAGSVTAAHYVVDGGRTGSPAAPRSFARA